MATPTRSIPLSIDAARTVTRRARVVEATPAGAVTVAVEAAVVGGWREERRVTLPLAEWEATAEATEPGDPYRAIASEAADAVLAAQGELERREEARLQAIERTSPVIAGCASRTGGATWYAVATYEATGRPADLRRSAAEGGDHPRARLAGQEALERAIATYGRERVRLEGVPTDAEVSRAQLARSVASVLRHQR